MSVKIGVIVGTTRPTRRGLAFAQWFVGQVKDTPDMQFDLIDLAEENLPFLDEPKSADSGEYVNESSQKWSQKIKQYDGIVFMVAEYNHGYTAPLKNAIDLLYHEWSKKPAAFVGYGGARAIEQLVNVVAKVKMVPMSSNTVRIFNPNGALDKDGNMNPDSIRGNVNSMTEELKWWSETLKATR